VRETWKPRDAEDVTAAISDALSTKKTLELIGAGSRREFGRPVDADVTLDLSALRGIVLYQPEELILVARPATPLDEISALLGARGQHLAFEPPDYGALWGRSMGAGTLGGAMLTGRGGPRRLSAGAPRDACLGVKGVNGFGEAFAGGGRVVKNVTGFDLPKLTCGSFGTLYALTELTVKVLPAPSDAATLVVTDLEDGAAIALMAKALASSAQVSSAAHLPEPLARASRIPAIADLGAAATVFRIEGVAPSVAARRESLSRTLGGSGALLVLDREVSRKFWREVAELSYFAQSDTPVWMISAPPSLAAAIGARLTQQLAARCLYDWAGGAIWIDTPPAYDAHAALIRETVGRIAGADAHATLIRASADTRRSVAPFQPLSPAAAALNARVRRQFDPQALFNPGRMYGES